MLLWRVSGLVLLQQGQNWNFCFFLQLVHGHLWCFLKVSPLGMCWGHMLHMLLTFPYSKVLILWAFFWEVSQANKFWPLRIITGSLLLDKIHSLLTEKKPPTDFIIVLAQSLKTTQDSQLSQVFSLNIWELWKSEISDQMVFLITKHSLQVKRAIHQRLPSCLLVIHFSLTEALLPNGRRKIVHLL